MLNFSFLFFFEKKFLNNWNPWSIFNVPYTVLTPLDTDFPHLIFNRLPVIAYNFLSGIKTDECQITTDTITIIHYTQALCQALYILSYFKLKRNVGIISPTLQVNNSRRRC